MAKHFLLIATLMAFTFSLVSAEDPVRVEIGTVDWKRDYAAAKESAVESGKPLLMFFQEVPG